MSTLRSDSMKKQLNKLQRFNYEQLKKLGIELFTNSNLVKNKTISESDIKLTQDFLAQAPLRLKSIPIQALWWEHIFLAAKLGKDLALAARDKDIDINPLEVEWLLLIHDLGRLIMPNAWLKNDLIGDQLLEEIGLPKEIINHGFFLTELAKLKSQTTSLIEFYNQLTPTQKIIFLADNLGKKNLQGQLLNQERFLSYLNSEPYRYPLEENELKVQTNYYGAHPAYKLVQEILAWLEKLGLNFSKIQASIENWGPKFIILARHGEVNATPEDYIYNRDQHMKPEDIVHLSQGGKIQGQELGKLIEQRHFQLQQIWTSPETRTQETASILAQKLKIKPEIQPELDEFDAPNAYLAKIKMKDIIKLINNPDWQQEISQLYPRENPSPVAKRMLMVFNQLKSQLKPGQSGILVSHGDPLAILANQLLYPNQTIPQGKKLRQSWYCPKGNALVIVIDPNNNFFSLYYLSQPNQTKIY